ncbi:nitrous oxide reductase accessory protein NosL [Paracoccus sp. SSJ]|uniref:nitrous oxide reductase accessory protein NosL n=1 Tax=Paracoccus sp. SSJ TaxID=3050636 RepID=UPI00254B648E|nr:nitrous oxide reductase accessory protein NosL [Paracoccus sp. SSJ]MDK8875171.1 nitrous oxide reductase accessory protein NosL [Paracoccus sp. SSJ]
MRHALLLVLLLGLAACREEVAQDTAPVEMNAQALGHFCQMNLLEHPGPKAQVHLEGMPGTPLFFSQVRDAIAYARMPEQSHPILAIQVNDMGKPGATWDDPGQGNWIDAADAFFVMGSAQAGGMGAPEAVPFSSREAAETFVAAQGGQVMRLDAIPDEMVLAPEETVPDSSTEADFLNRLRALSQPKEPAT